MVDDGSTDDTLSILKSYTSSSLKVFENLNPGKVKAFNLGVEKSSGKWVCLFAGDDIMPQHSLAKRLDAVASVSSEKPVVGLSRLIQISKIKKQNGIVIPRDPNRGGLTGTSYLMDRRAVAKFFPVPEELPNEDTWLEACVVHLDIEIVHSGVIGNQWRVHEGNSVNMLVPFREYNDKITKRMKAYPLFMDRHGSELSAESRCRLAAKVMCERARAAGDMVGVLKSKAVLVDRLRALSSTNTAMYEVRRKLYGLLSGW
ncbi:glycosyltransferase involved in cell wall biosynthesis [Nitrobacter winogradskyi]|uniref:Glycosyltransferase involved in cell wall biosynthesis n=1 Tax=Nitrobacter winogradskyi TaxID=913 RepID=A0ACC6AEZ1_NITWI|nr:glycosyltransferase involved in cell wall biosynthesis [Nitrobacter winogradskyi]